jgi:hypothetical protein
MTHSRKTKLTPAIRLCAATSLVVWLAALMFCSADCFPGDSHCQPSHHDEQAAASQHEHDQAPDSDKHGDCNDSFCDSLKTFVHLTGSSFLAKPDFGLAYTLGFASFSQATEVSQPEAPIFRQAWRGDWVFTPEVYLGPAFRSHAPPVLS